MSFNSPNPSLTITTVFATSLAALWMTNAATINADEPTRIVVSQSQQIPPRSFSVSPSTRPSTISRWTKLRSALPHFAHFGKRHSIPPIVVVDQPITSAAVPSRLVPSAPMPVLRPPHVGNTGRVRLSAFQSDDSETDDDDARAEPEKSDESDATTEDDDSSTDDESEDATSSDDDAEPETPVERFIPLSQLFARMETIDVAEMRTTDIGVRRFKQDDDQQNPSSIDFPENAAANHLSVPRFTQTHGDVSQYLWQTHSHNTHHPLYFEDIAAERCGTGHGCLTTWYSTARFFGRIPLVPYLVKSEPADSVVAVNTDCVPDKPCGFQDIQTGPALVEALAVSALVFAIP